MARTKTSSRRRTRSSSSSSRGVTRRGARGRRTGAGVRKASRRRRPAGRKATSSSTRGGTSSSRARRSTSRRTRKSRGRRYSQGAQNKIGEVMHEMKQGELRSGRSGKKVRNRRQAIAIGISEARRAGKKVPPKRSTRR